MFDKHIQFNVTFMSKRVKTEAVNRSKARRSCVPAAALITRAMLNVVETSLRRTREYNTRRFCLDASLQQQRYPFSHEQVIHIGTGASFMFGSLHLR